MTMNFNSLGSFALHLLTTAAAISAAEDKALESVGRLVEKEAKKKIGEYQPQAGPFVAWAWLAPATIDDKERKGFAPPDNPLLRSGEMRDSIEHARVGKEVHIGSNNDKAVWQELGTRRMPPRSFLGSAAFENVDKIVNRIGAATAMALAGQGVHNGNIDIIEAKARPLMAP